MKHPLLLLSLFSTLLLVSACASPQERAARTAAQITADEQECTRLGFTPDTEKFADCLLRLKEIRAQEAGKKTAHLCTFQASRPNRVAMRQEAVPDPLQNET